MKPVLAASLMFLFMITGFNTDVLAQPGRGHKGNGHDNGKGHAYGRRAAHPKGYHKAGHGVRRTYVAPQPRRTVIYTPAPPPPAIIVAPVPAPARLPLPPLPPHPPLPPLPPHPGLPR